MWPSRPSKVDQPLAAVDWRHTIRRWARDALGVGAGMGAAGPCSYRPSIRLLLVAAALATCSGCALLQRSAPLPPPSPRVLVVAPVLNYSGGQDFDPLKVTDLIASEFVSFEGISVVPVNLTLAELVRQGKTLVETPEEAVELARVFGADATVVVAVTEYNPYDPPVVGLVMQWYSAHPQKPRSGFDPLTASRSVSSPQIELSAAEAELAPRWQVQRVFNAADEDLLEEIRSFAAQRGGDESPYGWRKYIRSQELYVRYATWALIRTMLMLDRNERAAVEPHGAQT